MNVDDIQSCSYSRGGFPPRVTSPVIWGMAESGSVMFPLCYLRKPRGTGKEDWNKFLDRFTFEIMKAPVSEDERRQRS